VVLMPRTWLMGTRGAPDDDELEAEPVLVEHDEHAVTLTLDDGEEITVDRRELIAALVHYEQQAA
jgi:hypothetical protein